MVPRGWNAHDVDAVLAHFHDDVVFTSPVAARLLPESGGVVQGVVQGKEALRTYLLEFDDDRVRRGSGTYLDNPT